jgi:aryl-alcohol dehydrogenase-like predicted oxidoreductase
VETRNSKQMKNVNVLGFGGWQVGNQHLHQGGTIEEGITLVQEAYNQGINFFDTAPNYGLGNSETIIGEALQNVREHVYINSKVGHHPDGNRDFSSNRIKESILGSLTRLQTDYLDSVILHNPDRYILEGKGDQYQELEKIKQEGLIKAYGVSIDALEEFEIALNNPKIEVIELLFNIISQEPKKLFDKALEKGITLIIKIPFDSGWLTGKYTDKTTFTDIRSRWSDETKKIRYDIVEEIKSICREKDMVKNALAFIKSYEAVTVIIPGIKNLPQLYSNLDAIDYNLPEDEKKELENLYETKWKNMSIPW